MFDRLWATSYGNELYMFHTTGAVAVGPSDFAPASMLQTSFLAESNAGWYYELGAGTNDGGQIASNDKGADSNLPGTPVGTSAHSYYVALYFAEVDQRVNAPGLRVFDITINGHSFKRDVDIYNEVGSTTGKVIPSIGTPLGPYSSILINATGSPDSKYPPFIAGAEILQLLDDPMALPTSPIDGNTLYSLI